MGRYIAEQVVRLMMNRKIQVLGSRALVLGLTFKENCPDLRNSRAIDVVRELLRYNVVVDVYDPCVTRENVLREYDIEMVTEPGQGDYDALIIAVGHEQFRDMGAGKLRALCRPNGVIYDVKGLLPAEDVDARL
jgi:UDP-N-acetyl-D-galactosamine dehydrogenase